MEGKELVDGYWLDPEDAKEYRDLKAQGEHWDRIQMARKLYL